MTGINTSRNFMYPLLSKMLVLPLYSNLKNTYIYHTSYNDSYTLTYEFEESTGVLTSGHLMILHKKFETAGLILEKYVSPDYLKLAYTIRRPETLVETFKLFEEGKYSKINQFQKYTIGRHMNQRYGIGSEIAEEAIAILFKDPKYREKLEEKFGFQFKEDMELGSKPEIQNEMFDPSMILSLENLYV